jgi:hypothetical protein
VSAHIKVSPLAATQGGADSGIKSSKKDRPGGFPGKIDGEALAGGRVKGRTKSCLTSPEGV